MGLDGPLLPPASVLVHPRLPAAVPYPFGELSGAGVAFKLAWAVAQRQAGSGKVPPQGARCSWTRSGWQHWAGGRVVPLRRGITSWASTGWQRTRSRENPSVDLEAAIEASGVKPDQPVTSEETSGSSWGRD